MPFPHVSQVFLIKAVCHPLGQQADLGQSTFSPPPGSKDAPIHLVGYDVDRRGEIQTREYTQKTTGKKPVDVKKSITEIRVTSIMNLDRAKKTDGLPAQEPEGAAA